MGVGVGHQHMCHACNIKLTQLLSLSQFTSHHMCLWKRFVCANEIGERNFLAARTKRQDDDQFGGRTARRAWRWTEGNWIDGGGTSSAPSCLHYRVGRAPIRGASVPGCLFIHVRMRVCVDVCASPFHSLAVYLCLSRLYTQLGHILGTYTHTHTWNNIVVAVKVSQWGLWRFGSGVGDDR